LNIPVHQIEYGVKEAQRDKNHDNIPQKPIEITDEIRDFIANVSGQVNINDSKVVSYSIEKEKYLSAITPLKLMLED